MRTSCPLCGSVACMLQSPAFCRTTRQNRAPGTTPVMPAGVVVRPSAMFAPAAVSAPFAAYESLGALLASAPTEDPEPIEPTSTPPRRRPAGRTRR